MDASESDIFIQKHAADFVADFDRSLEPFLRKPNGQLRQRVRARETARLISKGIEHFQELPQLLDPHLPRWLPPLANAYLESLHDRRRSKTLSTRSQLLQPLPNAICRILYTFCKVRGEKVIVRFLNVETKYLELLLQAIEDAENESSWTWHERYVVLIWLSQLFFAPFDLATISSGETEEFDQPVVAGFQWPPQVPRITLRVIPLATRYLSSPGKERDGAKALLVRLAMRKDMQEMGVLSALVQWALQTLKPTKENEGMSPYYHIGSLSFLAGVLRASEDTSIMDQHLSAIFYAVQAIPASDSEVCKAINNLALARKMMIKVTRSIISILLRKSRQSMSDTEMIETAIGYLLEALADNDTPVRFAASKALSIITLKLDPDMASQVIEAVLESLNRNVLWVKSKSDPKALPTRDLTAVDPLEWHGLVLTLSHLLYRRSPPPDDLSNIIHALLIGLSFEKRGVSGGSIGTNVRDASCFGIWALARRYTTTELLQVKTQSVLVARGHDPAASILQVIATELVVTASLDPAGNIRRGASAALQELIGRHPDTVEQGISVVQAVDYHAVALRSRAIDEVALRATRLSSHYGNALLEATLGWRGIGDMDAAARRVSASSFGTLSTELARESSDRPLEYIKMQIESLLARIKNLEVRQVEERHGLVLSLAALFDSIPGFINENPLVEQASSLPISKMLDALSAMLQEARDVRFRKAELLAEAYGTLVVSTLPILLLSLSSHEQGFTQMKDLIRPGSTVVEENSSTLLLRLLKFMSFVHNQQMKSLEAFIQILERSVEDWLDRNDAEVIKPCSEAALVLLVFSSPSRRAEVVQQWCNKVSQPVTTQKRHGDGFFHALARSYPILIRLETMKDGQTSHISVSETICDRWAKDNDILTRVAILQSIIDREILKAEAARFIGLLIEGLEDYTTTARGDVGSLVRIEAVRATRTLWLARGQNTELTARLLPHILRLAAEKLDRVRAEAQMALATVLRDRDSETFKALSISSKEYFEVLFSLCDTGKSLTDTTTAPTIIMTIPAGGDRLSSLLAGLATSADTGNEDLVIVTRAALADYCETNVRRVCAALVHNLGLYAGQDRVLVPTLEVVAFLFHVGLLPPRTSGSGSESGYGRLMNLKRLCLLVQKAGYKTGNVRKLEACVKVYGAIAAVDTTGTMTATEETTMTTTASAAKTKTKTKSPMTTDVDKATAEEEDLSGNGRDGRLATAEPFVGAAGTERGRDDNNDIDDGGPAEARKRLGALLLHPWPKIRSLVVDELWNLNFLLGSGHGIDGNVTEAEVEVGEEEGEKEDKSKARLLLGVDWGRADKASVKRLVSELSLSLG
ncbi:beta-tubulin cofactor d [Xylariaceae sp. FL0594]|nr:beta-tubulin cofactor d [Xylariaceae sp. FL0594]